MPINVPTPVPPFAPALGANFNTFTTRKDVSPLDLPVFQSGTLWQGSRIRLTANGEFSTTGTPTLALGFYIGTVAQAITTVIAESSAITTGSGAASWPWNMWYEGECITTGTAGTVTGSGVLYFGTALTTFSIVPIPITLALRTFTWDTTIARAVGVCATWNTSSASNNVRTYTLTAMIVNGP